VKKKGKRKGNKKRRKCNKKLKHKHVNKKKEKNQHKKVIKEKEPKIKVPTHELLTSTLSYLMLTPCWYPNPSNLSSRTPFMLSLVFLCLSSHYMPDLLPRYESVHLGSSVRYVQTISNNVAHTSAIANLSSMSSFRTRFLLVCPQIHRSMCISATLSYWTCHHLGG
jgi:hypothetical protein